MKTKRLLLSLCLFAAAILAGGCATRTIEAASTKFEIVDPAGKSVSVILPKNISADTMTIKIPTERGLAEFTTTNVASDAGTVIDRASAAQAAALGKLTDSVASLATLVITQRANIPPSAPPAPPPAPEPQPEPAPNPEG